MSALVYWVVGGLTAAAGAGLAARSLIGDRARGRRRCPKCWHDLAGVPHRRCPECGHSPASERGLQRTRRYYRRATAGVLLALAGAILCAWPRADRAWFARHLPVTAHITLLPWIEDQRDPFLEELRNRAPMRDVAMNDLGIWDGSDKFARDVSRLSALDRWLLCRNARSMLSNDKRPWAQDFAIDWLGALGPDAASATPDLARLLGGACNRPHFVVQVLGRVGPGAAPAVGVLRGVLQTYLRDRTADTREAQMVDSVCLALGRIGPAAASATSELAELLSPPDGSNTSEAAVALGLIGPGARDALPQLTTALGAPACTALPQVATAIGRIGPDDAAGRALAAALCASDAELREAAAAALRTHPQWLAEAIVLAEEQLRDAEPSRRIEAAMGIEIVVDLAARSVAPLTTAAQDSDPFVRYAAIRTLGKMGPSAADCATILAGLAHDDPEQFVRDAATEAAAGVVAAPDTGSPTSSRK